MTYRCALCYHNRRTLRYLGMVTIILNDYPMLKCVCRRLTIGQLAVDGLREDEWSDVD